MDEISARLCEIMKAGMKSHPRVLRVVSCGSSPEVGARLYVTFAFYGSQLGPAA